MVRCIPPVETSHGQVWYFFVQMYPPVKTSCGQGLHYFKQPDLWSDVPPLETSHIQVWYYFKQVDLWSDIPKTPNGPQHSAKVIYGLQSTFVSPAWPWSGRSLPKGNSGSAWTLDWGPMWLGSQTPAINYLTNLEPDRLIFCHMAGWLANCIWKAGWLADCLLNKMSTDPPPGRDILWPCV